MSFTADICDLKQVQSMVEAIQDELGTIDILVNNAGILRTTRPLEDIEEDEWDLMMTGECQRSLQLYESYSADYEGAAFGQNCQCFVFSWSRYQHLRWCALYHCESSVLGLTRHTAREVAPFGINVNATAPGSMDTDMVRELATPEHIETERENNLLGRLGTAEDEANLVLFLVSDEASYITGATVDLNGGDLMM